jgi:hypothetical protein
MPRSVNPRLTSAVARLFALLIEMDATARKPTAKPRPV